ncbi:LysR substrate-binding domain-containing protein [Rhizobium viscosum]|uniref:Molybdate transport repressor ModE-like protein n=2 Tax=Rhizobium viscosum TaxID=1673 RepID=A0ABR9J217_RHIVS|nr:molybdate transport repressor ModE-like protein [Rhizobium viscosum]
MPYPRKMRFDLTDLRLFLAVVDAGSITHGAADVGLSLAAASERLRDMEALGEVTLLERSRRGVAPTEAGEALAHHARVILAQIRQMHGELGEYARGLRSTIGILANTAAMSEHLPEKLADWMAANPRVDLQLKERQSVEIARSVAAGHAEIGILSASADMAGLTVRPFAIDRLVVVVSSGHPLALESSVRFADLVDEHFIGLAAGALQDHIDAQAGRIGIRLKTRVRLRDFGAICRLAGAGVGIGIVPDTAARRQKRSSGIAIIRLSDEWATRHLVVCTAEGAELPVHTRSLLDHLAAARPELRVEPVQNPSVEQ